MRLYLDDSHDHDRLIAYLRTAGHDVTSPRSVGNRHISDLNHFRFAAERGLVILTGNRNHFVAIHDRFIREGQTHAGLIVVHYDHHARRDMSDREIVDAMSRLESSGVPLENEVHNLNQWR